MFTYYSLASVHNEFMILLYLSKIIIESIFYKHSSFHYQHDNFFQLRRPGFSPQKIISNVYFIE